MLRSRMPVYPLNKAADRIYKEGEMKNGRIIEVDAAKICGGAEMLLNRNPANIRKWIKFGFITLKIPAGSVRCSQASCPSIWANSCLHCSLIYSKVPVVFFVQDQPLRVK